MSKFRIKVSPWWASDDYIILKYSTNGIFWKTLKNYEYDVLDKWCYMTTKVSHYTNAEYLINKFKSLEDIIKYEEEEEGKVITHNNEINARNKIKKQEKQKVYKKYN